MNLQRLLCVGSRLLLKHPGNLTSKQARFLSLGLIKQTKHEFPSVQTAIRQKEDSFLTRILKKVPFLEYDKTRIMNSAYVNYEKIADKIDYFEFFEELNLPDTFYSWFVITELHIWMLSARAMAEGDHGRHLRNFLVEALWNDVAQRIKKLGTETNSSIARQQVAELSEQLQAALIAYDEGLQSDDLVLAGALWRRFYQQQDIEPLHLETLVKYVRKQMRLLDHLSYGDIFDERKTEWIHLK